jgi:hypothetical protein
VDAEALTSRGLEEYRRLVQLRSWIALAITLTAFGALILSFIFVADLTGIKWLSYVSVVAIVPIIWLCHREIRIMPWSLSDAAELFERHCDTKARASAYVSLIQGTAAADPRKRRLIAEQLSPLVTPPALRAALPKTLGPRLCWLSCTSLGALVLSWGLTIVFPTPPPPEAVARITRLIEKHPELPEKVQSELKELEKLYAEGPNVSPSEIAAALEKSAATIDAAQRELEEEPADRSTASVEAPKEGINTAAAQASPTPRPTATPTVTPSPPPSPGARPSPKSEPPPKDTDVQNSKQDSGGQKPSDKKDSKEGDGDGEGSGGDGAGKTGQGEGKQGGDQSSGSGSGETKGKGSKDGKGSAGSAEGSSNSEQKDGAGGSGEDSGAAPEKDGKNQGLSEAKKLVQELKQQGKQGEGAKSGGDQSAPKPGSEGATGEQGKSNPNQGNKGNEGQDSSGKESDKKDSSQQDQSGQKPGDQSGKPGEKSPQDGKADGGEKPGDKPNTSHPQNPSQKPGSGNPGKGEKPSQPDPKAKKQPGDGAGKGGDGLKGELGYKDVEVKEKIENVDTRFTSEDESRVKNSQPAGSKRQIEDLKLDRPKNDPERGAQLVPPEYRELLGE